MAKGSPRPGRTLISFFVGLAIAFGLVALTGTWKPALGLDLEGGTRITLIAQGNPSEESLQEARGIIDSRVNGSGVTEAEVTTGGGNTITVEIPGENARNLIDVVERQAQLRFRLVACSDFDPTACAGATQVPGQQPQVTVPGQQGGGQQGGGQQGGGQQGGGQQGGGQNGAGQQGGGQNGGGQAPSANRPPVGFATSGTATPSPSSSPSATDDPSDAPQTDEPDATGSPSAEPTEGETQVPDVDQSATADVDEALAFAQSPDQDAIAAYNQYTCTDDGVLTNADGSPASLVDDPNKFLVACSPPEGSPDDTANFRPAAKYLLSKAVIEGTDLDSASAQIPQNQVQWVVALSLGGEGRDVFTEISSALVQNGGQFAIVLDGSVISAPTMEARITDGNSQISGNFNETTANELATSLKFGALPISFEDDPSAETIGPSLAGEQLTAGLTAGGIGLVLVMVYCLFYYRGLGVVVLLSLVMAAALTYAMVLLLSETAGFTLTLPGIAGLIIAVGITADSFIILFERIRDEMRDGKSMRVAVETGWARARNTTLAADGVSLLAAVVLYIFAAGVVKGFAFALGLTTILDLVVFFFFTKPMMSYLARFKFFNSGHRFSGLSAETLGVDRLTPTTPTSPATAGGKA